MVLEGHSLCSPVELLASGLELHWLAYFSVGFTRLCRLYPLRHYDWQRLCQSHRHNMMTACHATCTPCPPSGWRARAWPFSTSYKRPVRPVSLAPCLFRGFHPYLMVPIMFWIIFSAVIQTFQNILVLKIIDGQKWCFWHSISITETKS